MEVAQPEYDVGYNGKGLLWPFDLFLYDHGALQYFSTMLLGILQYWLNLLESV